MLVVIQYHMMMEGLKLYVNKRVIDQIFPLFWQGF